MFSEFEAKHLLLGIGALFILMVVASGIYTIDEGNKGVLLRWGKLVEVVDSGIHLKMPFAETIHEMTVRTQNAKVQMGVYSKDVQGATVELSVLFALKPENVGNMYTVGGLNYVEKLVLPQINSRPKDVFGKYNAVNIVNSREVLVSEIVRELDKAFNEIGVVLQSVQLENIDFSDSYERSVEQRMEAEVEVQKVQQNLEREKINADMLRARAQGEADAKLARAQADAKAIEVVSKAEAEAIKAKNAALKENGPSYVQMIQAEKWDGKLPNTMIPGGAVPFLKTN